MPSTYSLHFVHAWLSDEADFLRSRVGVSFPHQKKTDNILPHGLIARSRQQFHLQRSRRAAIRSEEAEPSTVENRPTLAWNQFHLEPRRRRQVAALLRFKSSGWVCP
jgi:hypothetical protein